jgi:hypothetical protein
MANENRFDSGHVVIPVLHPSGDVHNIAVPEDTPLADLHSALAQDYAHPAIEGQEKQPTEEGAEENRPAFREAARKAWQAAASGILKQEAGFIDYKNPLFKPEQLPVQKGAEMKIDVPNDAFATAHTHPNERQQDPSVQDIDNAKKSGKPVYVVSRQGLYMVRPSDGKVIQVFKGTDWMDEKKKIGAQEFSMA